MDVLIGLIVIACIVATFVIHVRRTNANGVSAQPNLGHRPEPLSQEQRKALKLKERKTTTPAPPRSMLTTALPSKKSSPSVTRAIRTGWSLGDVAFNYEDSSGAISYRTVTAHSVTSTHLKGECHEKRAERTFRLDRIVGELTDCETGEVLSPEKWARRLQ